MVEREDIGPQKPGGVGLFGVGIGMGVGSYSYS